MAPADGDGPFAAGQFLLLLTVRALLDQRVLFFGGKGGVGKTTCASAFALTASRRGKRVLLVSTDPAHSTSDIFERPFGRDEREVLPSLAGLEVDAEYEARRYLEQVKERIGKMFAPEVVREAFRQMDVVAGMPGLADVALFDRITELVLTRLDTYDVIVFDTAPSGHTLRLLQMPDAMSSWVEALAARRRAATSAASSSVGDVGRRGSSVANGDPVLETLTARQARLAAVRHLLTRYETTAFVLVLVPERLPIEESARAVHELDHAHLKVGAAIVNRVLPDGLSGEYYAARKTQEGKYLEEIDRRFRGLPQVRIPLLESDVHGVEALARIADFLVR
ncbi:MAG: ArsA family ATPase [Bacteroidales bacterium]